MNAMALFIASPVFAKDARHEISYLATSRFSLRVLGALRYTPGFPLQSGLRFERKEFYVAYHTKALFILSP